MEGIYALGLIQLAMKRSLTEEQYKKVVEEYKRLLQYPHDVILQLLQGDK